MAYRAERIYRANEVGGIRGYFRQGFASVTMRAATVVEPLRIEIEEVPMPDPGPEEVRVEIQGCGVCASNIPPFEGREWFNYPMEPGALGHEAWGVVEAVGSEVLGLKVGDRVTSLSFKSYAEFDIARASAVVKIPKSLATTEVPGEPLGCAMNIFARSGIKTGDAVAIVGIGFLGSILTALATAAGAKVIAIARRPYALGVAKAMGAAHLIEMDDHWQIIDQVKAITGERLCDVVIEAVGKQWPLDLASDLTGIRGRLVIAGYHQDGLRQINMQNWNWKGIDVINAHEREEQVYLDGIVSAIEALQTGRLNPSPLYTHRFPLEQLGDALLMTRDRPDGFMKALITI